MYKAIMKPQDCLILGNGKPFNAGENIFRSVDNLFFNIHIYSILNRLFKDVRLNSIIFYKNFDDTLIFPFPLDYIYFYSKDKILKPILSIKQPEIKFIDDSNLKEYLKGKHFKKKFNLKKLNKLNILKNNNKDELKSLKEDIENTLKNFNSLNISYNSFETGIKIDKKNKTTGEGNLYIEEKIYLSSEKGYEDIDIFVLFETKEEPQHTTYIHNLGGESKTIKILIEQTNDFNEFFSLENEIKNKIQQTKYFKIILLTPTNYPPEIEGAERIAQLTGKPIAFSGWFNVYDKEKKIDSFPSRLFKLIPAGSVFYYKIDDEITKDDKKLEEFTEKLFKNYWLKPSFFVPEYPYFERAEDGTNPLGFGLSIIGVAKVEED